jgi:hypothetical protein
MLWGSAILRNPLIRGFNASNIICLVVDLPLKMMEFVSWDDYSLLNGNIKHVPNHQPVIYSYNLEVMIPTRDKIIRHAWNHRPMML